MGLLSVSSRNGARIELDGAVVLFAQASIGRAWTTEQEIQVEVTKQVGRTPTKSVFLHKNRDGSVAVRVGISAPEQWPEDEQERWR